MVREEEVSGVKRCGGDGVKAVFQPFPAMLGAGLGLARGKFRVSGDQRRGGKRASGVGEFAFWLGDGAVEGFCGFDPLGDDGLGVGDRLFVGGSIGHAAGKLGDFH